MTDGVVKYAVDRAAPSECESFGEIYICGYERTDTFVITGSRGAESGSATLEVARDECHVVTEDVSVLLE